MAYEVYRTDSFEHDYERAIRYLIEKFDNPQAAANLMDEVEKVSGILAVTPYIRAVSSKKNLASRAIRVLILTRYALMYVVEGSSVHLVRLFHQSQLYDADWYWDYEG